MALVMILLASFSPITKAAPPPRIAQPKPLADAYTLIAEVNALRTANGLPPYTINATLMAVAQTHSDYQAATGTITHYSADGSRPFQRALAAGYPVGGTLSAGGYFSENIVAGMGMTPQNAVQIWQGDAPHLNTMLSQHLTEVGAGVTNAGGVIYYTLDASTPATGTVIYNTPDPNATPDGETSGALPTLDWIMPVITSTPDDTGKVVHQVQVGQSLWGIADIYGTTVQEIRTLNNMSAEELVYPGEMLYIRTVATLAPTSTPSLAVESTMTATKVSITETSLPASDPQGMWVTFTPEATPSAEVQVSGSLWIVILIIFLALALAGLVTWFSGRELD